MPTHIEGISRINNNFKPSEICVLQSDLSSLYYALFNVPLKRNLSTCSREEQLRYPCHIQRDKLTKQQLLAGKGNKNHPMY